MMQVVVESPQGVETFPVHYMEDALDMARKMGVLMFDVTVSIYDGTGDATLLEKQHWYNGMVTHIPVGKMIEPDPNKCTICNDTATTTNGMIPLCGDCMGLWEEMVDSL
jgi:hypothetical protein